MPHQWSPQPAVALTSMLPTPKLVSVLEPLLPGDLAWTMALCKISPWVPSPPRSHWLPSFGHRLPASQLAVFLPLQMPFLQFRSRICYPLLLGYLDLSISRGDCLALFFFLIFFTMRPQTLGPQLVYAVWKHPSVRLRVSTLCVVLAIHRQKCNVMQFTQ